MGWLLADTKMWMNNVHRSVGCLDDVDYIHWWEYGSVDMFKGVWRYDQNCECLCYKILNAMAV